MNKNLDQYQKSLDKIASLKQIDEQLLVTPIKEGAWSIREIVGHLYGWDNYNLQHMVSNMSQGADLPAFPDHDSQNVQALQGLQGKSVQEIIKLFIEKRQEIIGALAQLDTKTRFTIGGGKRAFSPESFVKIFVKHDHHHFVQIDEYLSSKVEK